MANNNFDFTIAHQQIFEALKPIMATREQLLKSLEPTLEFINQFQSVHQAAFENLSVQLNSIHFATSSAFSQIAEHQKQIVEALSAIDFSIYKFPISYETSQDFSDMTLEVIQEIESCEISKDSMEPIQTARDLSSQNSRLTWADIATIASLLMALIGLIQSNMPNEQLTNIENSLEQLIELQEKELLLLEKQNSDTSSYSIQQEFEQFCPKLD